MVPEDVLFNYAIAFICGYTRTIDAAGDESKARYDLHSRAEYEMLIEMKITTVGRQMTAAAII